jgi:hypothetical protein
MEAQILFQGCTFQQLVDAITSTLQPQKSEFLQEESDLITRE